MKKREKMEERKKEKKENSTGKQGANWEIKQ